MGQITSSNETPTRSQDSRPALKAASPLRSSFRYYIHDGIECFRLQLVGELLEHDVPELAGCWTTARITLKARKLVLDLTALTKTDEAGHEWLLSMVREGAASLPESYFRDRLAGQTGATPKSNKLSNFWRGGRRLEVENP